MIASRRSPPAQTCARNRMDIRFGIGEETPKRTLRARAIEPGAMGMPCRNGTNKEATGIARPDLVWNDPWPYGMLCSGKTATRRYYVEEGKRHDPP